MLFNHLLVWSDGQKERGRETERESLRKREREKARKRERELLVP